MDVKFHAIEVFLHVVAMIASCHLVDGSIRLLIGCSFKDNLGSVAKSSAMSLAVSVAVQKKGGDSDHPIWTAEGIPSRILAPSTLGKT